MYDVHRVLNIAHAAILMHLTLEQQTCMNSMAPSLCWSCKAEACIDFVEPDTKLLQNIICDCLGWTWQVACNH